MPEPFKNLINAGTIAAAGRHLSRIWPAFERAQFERLAGHDLQALEMKGRAMQIAAALQTTLPADFDQAAAIIEAALAPPVAPEAPASERLTDAGLAGWVVWSLGEYVARQVAQDPARLARGLTALHALTQRFSAEFAIRPLIRDHQAQVFDTLVRWTDDASPHVRRLVSEGSRPRLPWGLRLQRLIDDPSPSLPLLARLQDDDSAYVRRSVANHLNDIAKDHPALVAGWVSRHLPGASAARGALLRHASRTLIKQGHADTLTAWGLGQTFRGTAALAVSPSVIAEGDSVTLSVSLASRARSDQTLVVDYVVHHVKANGDTSAKVFKGWSFVLPAGERRELVKRHSMRPITTRRYYPGWHRVQVQINGKAVAEAGFELASGPPV
ncbi:MAG: DNA alkylation repair protein [Burkholderiaceae bacterium]|nr:DNA alkylation repair protein [Burkholderiaceae bacterium]